jgi:bifunctional UDP-N-acetylglucosamine pyrophosphorylase/glucosamine-1-phosphate N-acetyltransferase
MELTPRSREKVLQMARKGISIPNPLSLDVGPEVDVDRISPKDVTIYPGCRIYGERTLISSGAKLGYEGPVTIDDCQIGKDVELRGGFFSRSVFLDKSSMGLGAQVREGCILEEEASGAHCVGLKQTILFPFVTLGSLINFCDCLMAGGTSRRNHSEVGSSYIHFNFTPDGDKTTPSLIGDVPRGVMLNQAPIFLGGQGGMVGPLRLGYGNVVVAGSILRTDHPQKDMLIVGKTYSGGMRHRRAGGSLNLTRIVENNLLYLANLSALEQWYTHVRRPFLEENEFGAHIYAGLMDKLLLARAERLKRLKMMAERIFLSHTAPVKEERGRRMEEFHEKIGEVEALLQIGATDDSIAELRDRFLAGLKIPHDGGSGYVETIKGLPPPVSDQGTSWLDSIVSLCCETVSAAMPAMGLFSGSTLSNSRKGV